jgi:hypothetical protein
MGKPRQATARSGTHLTHPEVCLGALRGGRPRLQHLGAAAERRRERSGERPPLARLGALAADTLARAVARGVYEASPWPDAGPGEGPPAWRDRR